MRNSILFLFIIAFFAGIGCNPDDELLQKRFQNEDNASDTPIELFSDNSVVKESDLFAGEEICGQIVVKPLLTNGNFVGGTLFIANNEGKIIFKFLPVEGWLISEINLYVGDGIQEIPVSQSGNPLFSEFPDTYIYDPPLPEVSIPVDLLETEVGDDGNITVVAHAKITDGDELDPAVKSVIAQWDDDLLFLGPRRGGGFTYDLQSCDIDPDGTSGEDLVSTMDEELLVGPLCVDLDQLPLLSKNYDPAQQVVLGMVELSTDVENMIFSFSVEDPDWMISAIHINVGDFDDDQFNGSGNVPKGKYDFNMSYDPAEVATAEVPLDFKIPFIEIEGDLDEEKCGKFYIEATLYQEIWEDGILVEVNTQSVSVAWSQDPSLSGRRGAGSLTSGSQGAGNGSQGAGSVDPASVIICLDACATE